MENKLSITEIRYIRSLASKKTDEELAEMIGKPVALVQMQFSLMSDLPKRPWERGPIIKPTRAKKKKIKGEKKKATRGKKKIARKEPKPEKQSGRAQEQKLLIERKKKLEKSTYATRPLNLTGTVPVKLNSKTTVYVKPGTDINELKKRYKIC